MSGSQSRGRSFTAHNLGGIWMKNLLWAERELLIMETCLWWCGNLQIGRGDWNTLLYSRISWAVLKNLHNRRYALRNTAISKNHHKSQCDDDQWQTDFKGLGEQVKLPDSPPVETWGWCGVCGIPRRPSGNCTDNIKLIPFFIHWPKIGPKLTKMILCLPPGMLQMCDLMQLEVFSVTLIKTAPVIKKQKIWASNPG